MYRPFLALRYLLTRPINLLGVGGVTIGVWALIVVVSIFSGFLEVVGEHVRSASADVTARYLPATASFAALRAEIESDPNVRSCSPRVVHFGLINRPGTRPPPSPLLGRGALQGGDTPFLFVIGIDPESEQATTSLADWLRAPSPEHRVADLDAPLAARDGLPTILLGEARMTAAGLRPGDIVVMNTAHTEAGPDGSGVEKIEVQLAEDGSRGAPRFVVAGAYRTRHTGYDGNNAFVDIEVLRRLLGMPEDLVQEIVIALHDRATTEQTAERLDRAVRRELDQERMPSQRGARTQSWRTWNFAFLRNVEWQRSLMKIVLIVIMAVAAVLMFATLSMMVTEKTGDIGILTWRDVRLPRLRPADHRRRNRAGNRARLPVGGLPRGVPPVRHVADRNRPVPRQGLQPRPRPLRPQPNVDAAGRGDGGSSGDPRLRASRAARSPA